MIDAGGVASSLDELRARLDALAADHERLRAEHDALLARVGGEPDAAPLGAAEVAGPPTPSEPGDRPRPPDARRSRRAVLRGAGVAAAGAVAGGVASVVAPADPAAANSGNNFVLGVANTATTPTAIAVSGVTSYGLGVTDVSLGAFPRSGAISGHTSGDFTSGVFGYDNGSGSGAGVAARSENGTALDAYGESGIAVVAQSAQGTALVLNGRVEAWFVPSNSAVPTRAESFTAGQMHCDNNRDLWFCVASGTPGTWRKVAGPATAGSLHPLAAPVRCYDSRPIAPAGGGPKGVLVGGTQRTIDTKNLTGVPAGATAVLVNLTVTNTSPAGFLALYSNALSAWPGTSNINWDHAGQTVANTALVAVDASAQLKAYAPTNTDFLIDVIGYYQ